MSFSGFVFDMIRRDKQNRDLRNLRKERQSGRMGQMHSKGANMPLNTTPEDMNRIARMTKEKEQSEQKYTLRMMLIILGISIFTSALLLLILIN